MSQTAETLLAGTIALVIMWVGWKAKSFGVASDRNRNPINFWLGFAVLAFGSLICFGLAVSDLLRGR